MALMGDIFKPGDKELSEFICSAVNASCATRLARHSVPLTLAQPIFRRRRND